VRGAKPISIGRLTPNDRISKNLAGSADL
jgi:hypothetical protein